MKKLTTTKPEESLLGHIEKIIELSKKSGLSDIFFTKAKTHIQFASEILNLNDIQTVLFAHFVNKSAEPIRLSEIADELKCNTVRIIQYMNEVDELEHRKLVRCSRSKNNMYYRVPLDVVNALKKGENYVPPKLQNISIDDLFSVMEDLFEQRKNEELTFDVLVSELDALIEDNRHLAFVRQIRGYGFDEKDRVLLLFFCHLFVNNDDDCIQGHDFDDLYEHKSLFRRVKRELEEGEHCLFEVQLVEHQNSSGFGDRESFKLTDKAKQELLSELNLKPKQKVKKDFILCSSLPAKVLFYNAEEQRQIRQLSNLLQVENFKTVQQRLTGNGMRTGFACLFYGAPGTGKTETVYQLARETGRDIMPVDISETKSMWFGESEKCIKAIFDRYREQVKTCPVTPILLFNEADAVIGKRMENTQRAVDQTSNAIQNIILQEMETLNGILIATTNLTQNLDKAFERRFLYKIKFEKPGLNAKQGIWRSMMPGLSEAEAGELASCYDFSGGQIENIVRKRTVDSIISGEADSLESLHAHCQSELLDKDNGRKKVGFL
jgi:hypothetical protein